MLLSATLTLPRHERYVRILRDTLRTVLAGLDVAEEDIDDLELALTEASANVVRHAEDSAEYEVTVEVDADGCVIRVSDRGPGFAEQPGEPALPPAPAESGRGLALMQALTDELHFERDADGMTVDLRKRW
jgi:serine/threonine-protein kinase RsbW